MWSFVSFLLLVLGGFCAVAPLSFQYSDDFTRFTVIASSDGNEYQFRSGDLFLHANNETVPLCAQRHRNTTGIDSFGPYNGGEVDFATCLEPDLITFVTEIRYYSLHPNLLVFRQKFPVELTNTSVGNTDAVMSAFPSLIMNQSKIGFVHFSGFMAGHYPQYGVFNQTDTALAGGIELSGPLCLFSEDLSFSMVISPLSQFMSASLHVNSDNTDRIVQWGVMGGATSIPAGHEASWVMAAYEGGVNYAVKQWGQRMLQYYQKSPTNAHDRDVTLQYLGYSTDNGAFYYYYQGNHTTYQDTILAIKQYADTVGLPYRYFELDSWWYYQGIFSGIMNWTAQPDVFPDGMRFVHDKTELFIQAHNRYWALDNVYAANPLFPVGDTNYSGPKFEFVWGETGGIPATSEFWQYFFSSNSDWGLRVYEQDWLSTATNDMDLLQQNVTLGQNWLVQMGEAAADHGLSIQYCMSYPRHVLTSLLLPSVTQARASNDYYPQSMNEDSLQWNTGESGLWISSIGVAPSKDNFWSMSTPQYDPHYDIFKEIYESRNRLESLSASLSNGPVQPSDRNGFSNVSIIMRCCNQGGRILRPDATASPIDRAFLSKSFGSGGPDGVVHATFSNVGGSMLFTYILSLSLLQPFNVTLSDIVLFHWDRSANVPDTFIVFEVNTSSSFTLLDHAHPLELQISDQWSFQYFVLVPIFKNISVGWYLQGELTKWISASTQRFLNVEIHTDGGVSATVQGEVNEEITLAFVHATKFATFSHTCVMRESLQIKFHVASSGKPQCSF